ncbi:ShlB/FhaC/HecB family hemolysin secretion/activation protein [Campylobacter sp. MG1]|uniref:ShlB/FhaC/HecB family hemolysin secretion/activation protein n=1 Tax=Campylobacter sp. MG1 TaxID=2976332 RepID=UPI00226D0023|nr:ShlB/FhaC/HecB family hemolysin secretion/activation protein [Campylobacter sp. MG1]
MFRFFYLCIIFVSILFANDNQQREIKNEIERIKIYEQNIKTSNLENSQKNDIKTLLYDEDLCFKIDKILLSGDKNLKTKFILDSFLKKVKFKSGICLGEKGINAIINGFNNELISYGYITSYAVLGNTNLKSKKLIIKINYGKINKILINEEVNDRNNASLFTAFGEINHQKPLNMRNIETAIENISNATFGNVDISISPSENEGFSDIFISRTQRALPLSLQLSLDNYGSKETGSYQGVISLSAVNLFGFNEIYTFNYGGAIFYKKNTYLNDEKKHGNSNNFYGNFKIPFGNFSIDYTHSRYNYNQVIAGAYNLYQYSGVSRFNKLNLSYLLYRNQNIKFTPFFAIFKRESKNYIDEFELDNQKRITAGYELGAKLDIYFTNSFLSTNIAYKKGTGMLGAIPAPEQLLGEGTSRMRLWLLDITYNKNFLNNFNYEINFHAQYNKTPLTNQDKISIGGVYSVRGFDGEMSLIGQKGFYIKNTLSYNYHKNNYFYLAFDGGIVYDSNSNYNGKNKLLGAGLGFKGNISSNYYGGLSYDFLIAKPLKKPNFFLSKSPVFNFSLTYYF